MGITLIAAVAVVVIVMGGLAALLIWYVHFTTYRNEWRCESCGTVFSISLGQALLLPSHQPRRPKVTCPNCGARTLATAVPKLRT
jgi:DNA-directed RNA polymerase subunit RPC12/RpoP